MNTPKETWGNLERQNTFESFKLYVLQVRKNAVANPGVGKT